MTGPTSFFLFRTLNAIQLIVVIVIRCIPDKHSYFLMCFVAFYLSKNWMWQVTRKLRKLEWIDVSYVDRSINWFGISFHFIWLMLYYIMFDCDVARTGIERISLIKQQEKTRSLSDMCEPVKKMHSFFSYDIYK